MPKYSKGDEIVYTTGPLGAVAHVGDTRFMRGDYDAQKGQAGAYVEPVEVGGETWHVTTKTAPMRRGGEDVYGGPFIIVADQMIEPRHKNHAITEES